MDAPNVTIVTGAAGALGMSVTRALLASGHHVAGVDRAVERLASIGAHGTTTLLPLAFDALDAGAWADASTRIAGLASAIDVIHLSCDSGPAGFLTLEYSLAHLAGGPGRLQSFDEAINPVTVLSSSLVTPSSMILERRTGSIVVAELNTNRLISFVLP